jgi:hypothetical protein
MTTSCQRARRVIEQEVVGPPSIIDLYVDDSGSILSHGELVDKLTRRLDHVYVYGVPEVGGGWEHLSVGGVDTLQTLEDARRSGERTYRVQFQATNRLNARLNLCFNATPDVAADVRERLLQQLRRTAHHGLKEDRWSDAVNERLLRLLRREVGHGLAEASGSDDTVDGDLVTGRLISADVEPLLPPGTPTDMLSYYASDHAHTAAILGLRRWCQDHPGKGVYLVVSNDSLMSLYAALTPDEFEQLRQRLMRLDRASARDNLKEGLLPSPA